MAEQLTIGLVCDDRTPRLAAEFALVLGIHLPPGTTRESVKVLSERLAKMAERRYRDAWEPKEPIRCHTCDEMTTLPNNRVRVAVCNRCSYEGRSVGSTG